jgi:septation ring formation regulator EzrA
MYTLALIVGFVLLVVVGIAVALVLRKRKQDIAKKAAKRAAADSDLNRALNIMPISSLVESLHHDPFDL